jgi:hypothetical protein
MKKDSDVKKHRINWIQIVSTVLSMLAVAGVVKVASTVLEIPVLNTRLEQQEKEIAEIRARIANLEHAVSTNKGPGPNVNLDQTTLAADTECVQRERGATIEGQPVPLSSWQNDCAYQQPDRLRDKKVQLTTWGIVLRYAGNSIVEARVIAPHELFIFPEHASLFAGYSNKQGAVAAYKTSNPTGPKIDQ